MCPETLLAIGSSKATQLGSHTWRRWWPRVSASHNNSLTGWHSRGCLSSRATALWSASLAHLKEGPFAKRPHSLQMWLAYLLGLKLVEPVLTIIAKRHDSRRTACSYATVASESTSSSCKLLLSTRSGSLQPSAEHLPLHLPLTAVIVVGHPQHHCRERQC